MGVKIKFDVGWENAPRNKFFFINFLKYFLWIEDTKEIPKKKFKFGFSHRILCCQKGQKGPFKNKLTILLIAFALNMFYQLALTIIRIA